MEMLKLKMIEVVVINKMQYPQEIMWRSALETE